MALPSEILASIRRQIENLRKNLKDPNSPVLNGKGLMKQIGALGVAASQKAFRDQALGGIKWDPRYPGQKEPKLNIAGALMDFKSGRKAPKPNRFQDRPALIDEGQRGGMWGSLTLEVTGPLSVAWGTNKEYARVHQEGGHISIRYDDATRQRIKEWLYKPGHGPVRRKMEPRGVLRTNVVRPGLGGPRTRNEYAQHLRPLLVTSIWSQRIIRRPFVGITDELQKDINAAITLYFQKIQRKKL